MTLIAEWQKRGFEKGVIVGREQGIEKGVEKGRIELISKLLKLKFPTDADIWIKKLDTLNLNQLETISERILFSNSLPEIFDGLVH